MKSYLKYLVLLPLVSANILFAQGIEGLQSEIEEGLLSAQEFEQAVFEYTVLKFPDGTVYEGGVRDGVLNGDGKFTWANGSSFEGYFQDGKRDGLGILTSTNGEVKYGIFKDNELVSEFNELPEGYKL